jgi:uncharacterized protein YndB with AHSA1/START domain
MSTIQHLLHIQHPIEKVFRAISTSDGLSNWYSRTEAFTAEEGATFKIYFGEMGFQFEVVEFMENKKIAWKCMKEKRGCDSSTRALKPLMIPWPI